MKAVYNQMTSNIDKALKENADVVDNVIKAVETHNTLMPTDITIFENQYQILVSMRNQLQQGEENEWLTRVSKRVGEMDPAYIQIDQDLRDTNPDYARAVDGVDSASLNLEQAQNNYTKVMNDPSASVEEKASARGWLEGARQNARAKHQAAEDLRVAAINKIPRTPSLPPTSGGDTMIA